MRVFTEQHELVPPRAKLTSRAARWATDALTVDDTTVSALARHLGVDWHTCWDAVEAEATRRLADPARLDGVEVLGVDEHIWRPSRVGDAHRAVTGMVDLTRDAHGQLHARLLDVVPGRTGTAYAGWLKDQDPAFVSGVKHASLDPFRGYANAIRDELPDAVAVLDAFHVVKLGTQVVDEVRRRVQQDTLGRRGHKDDPLYKIRGLLRRGREHLSDKQVTKLNTCLIAGDPGWEVTLAWHAYQQLRSMYQAADPRRGQADRRAGHRLIPAVPDPRGRPPRPHPEDVAQHVLARFETHRISNGGTEAVNLLIEKTRRLAHGFRTFEHYRLRILLAASGPTALPPSPHPRLNPKSRFVACRELPVLGWLDSATGWSVGSLTATGAGG